MRILFVSDSSFTTREQDMLRRVEIGLLDEGARLVRVVPESFKTADETQLTKTLTFPDIGPRLMRPFRIAQMLERLAPLSKDPSKPPQFDIVHAWGERCWALARELAGVTGASLVLELWSSASLDRIKSFEHHTRSLTAMGTMASWSAADAAIAQRAKSLARWPVAIHPWGVHPPPAPRKPTGEDEPTPIVVLPEGHNAGHTIALLRGLARAMQGLKGEPPLILLAEAAVRGTRAVWKAVDSLGLTPITTVLSDAEMRREPVLLAEILAMPEAGGEHRSIALEAMAAGMVVACLNDPLVEAYRDDRTCHTVSDPTPHRWETAFAALLPDPARRRRLGLGGRTWIEQNRRVYQHISAIMDTYNTLIARANPIDTQPPPSTSSSPRAATATSQAATTTSTTQRRSS
ncbi:MAG: hypothetical protein ACTS3F_04845 [Phycisphaerales bacterium]